MCLLLGPTGAGKSLLAKRLHNILGPDGGSREARGRGDCGALRMRVGLLDSPAQLSLQDGKGDLGDLPPTRPTVGTDLTDIGAPRQFTIRELGGCMAPIWPSYFGDCRALLFMMDASDPTQLSAAGSQLLGLLSAKQLASASVLILFNKIDLPCYMSTMEMKSLLRLPDILACAPQNISVVEVSALQGTGLAAVLRWLQEHHGFHT